MPSLSRLLILAILSLSIYVHAAPVRDAFGTNRVGYVNRLTAIEGSVTAAAIDDSNEFDENLNTRDLDEDNDKKTQLGENEEDPSTLEPFALRKAKPAPKPPKAPTPKQKSTKVAPPKTTVKPPKTTQASPPTSTRTAPFKTTTTPSKSTKVTSTVTPSLSQTTKATTPPPPSNTATTTSQSSNAEQATETTTLAITTTATDTTIAEDTTTTTATDTTTIAGTTTAAGTTTIAGTTTPANTTSSLETTTPGETITPTETTIATGTATTTETTTSAETSAPTATSCPIDTPETRSVGARAYNYVTNLFRRDEPEFIGWHGTNSDTADLWQSKGQLEKPVKADGLLDFLGLGPRSTQGTSGADAELGPGVYVTDDQDIAVAFANNNAQVNKGTTAQLCAIFAKSSDNWRTAIRKAFIPENLVGDSSDPQTKANLEQARLDHIAQAVPGVCAAAVVKFSLLDRQRLTGQLVLPALITNQFTAMCFKADSSASAPGTSTFPDFSYNGDTLRGEWKIAHE